MPLGFDGHLNLMTHAIFYTAPWLMSPAVNQAIKFITPIYLQLGS